MEDLTVTLASAILEIDDLNNKIRLYQTDIGTLLDKLNLYKQVAEWAVMFLKSTLSSSPSPKRISEEMVRLLRMTGEWKDG